MRRDDGHHAAQTEFRRRLIARERLLGTFLKSSSPHPTEILAEAGFDFVVVDVEHAPFGPGDIDLLMLAARAARLASLVRVADMSGILTALDCGAAGVLVPHVDSPEKLQAVVSACRYDEGTRGFSNSPRAGRYGTLGLREHIRLADESLSILAMIEDPEALDRLDAIFAVPGLTGAFIGRGDLSARLGESSTSDPPVVAAVDRIADAARRYDVPLLAHVGSASDPDVAYLTGAGVSAYIVASDQGLLRQAVTAQRRAFDEG